MPDLPTSNPEQFYQGAPLLLVPDVSATADFYRRILGFKTDSEAETPEYRERVLPAKVTKRLAVEAGVAQGWDRWIGPEGATLTMDRYGASAPGGILMKEFGFTPENVAAKALALVRRS